MDSQDPPVKSNDGPAETPVPASGEQSAPDYWLEQAVPRTAEQRAELLTLRPPCWEYVLFASYLLAGQERLAPQWYDHRLEFVTPRGSELSPQEAIEKIQRAIDESNTFWTRLEAVGAEATFEAAWGKPGESGDPELIEHVTARFTEACDDMLQWAADLRSARVPEPLQPVFRTASHLLDKALEALRKYVDDWVAEMDLLPQRLASGENVKLNMELKTNVYDEQLFTTFQRQANEAAAALASDQVS